MGSALKRTQDARVLILTGFPDSVDPIFLDLARYLPVQSKDLATPSEQFWIY